MRLDSSPRKESLRQRGVEGRCNLRAENAVKVTTNRGQPYPGLHRAKGARCNLRAKNAVEVTTSRRPATSRGLNRAKGGRCNPRAENTADVTTSRDVPVLLGGTRVKGTAKSRPADFLIRGHKPHAQTACPYCEDS